MWIQGLAPISVALLSVTMAEQTLENYQLWWENDDQSAVNKTSCDVSTTSISFTLQPDTDSPQVNSDGELYIWWPSSNDDDCTSPQDDSAVLLVDGRVSDDAAGYFSDSAFEFPSEAELTFNYETVYSRVSETFCETDSLVERTEIRLCIGIEHPETDLTGNNAEREVYIDSVSELQIGVDFIIDSTPPSTPTISNISPRDGSIQFDATVDEESPYLKEWLIRYQEDDGSDSECSTWSDAQETTVAVSGLDTNSQSLNFTATNGIDYAFCVIATDDANNQSAPSETQKGTARDECDFIECYPGELQTGHCGTTNPEVLWLLFATLLALRLRRTWRPQSC